jgi:hypothetical protein
MRDVKGVSTKRKGSLYSNVLCMAHHFPGLKVKAKWMRLMMLGAKDMEVRRYPPLDHTPRGHNPLQVGGRLFLLCDGRIWGSAKLVAVQNFHCRDEFEGAAAHHCVCAGNTSVEVRLIYDALEQGRALYGWVLGDFRWFLPAARPISGEGETPVFKGQGNGQVWSRARLQASLDAAPTIHEVLRPHNF